MNAEQAAKSIRLVVLDVDGVLTDGGLYYDAAGGVLKRFNVQDGLGIKLATTAGIKFAVITGLDSLAVAARVKELGIEYYYPGRRQKVPCLRLIAEASGISPEHMAYVGDDWVDAAPMALVGLPMAVADARPEIQRMAAWTSSARGGRGAVREALEFILTAQGKLDALWRTWSEA